jgi:hypothetical protein
MFVPVYDAKNRLSALLADLGRAGEVAITRRALRCYTT